MDLVDKYLTEASGMGMGKLFTKKIKKKSKADETFSPAARNIMIACDKFQDARRGILNDDMEFARDRFAEGMAWIQKASKNLRGK